MRGGFLLMRVYLFGTLTLYVACTGPGKTVSGIVRARDLALGSRVGGMVLSVERYEGDAVRKGEVIARLDPARWLAERAVLEAALMEAEARYRDLKAGATEEEIRRARAELAGAEAQYRQALSGFREEEIRAAQNEVAALESQYEEARRRADRTIALHLEGFASTSERDAAVATRDMLKARRDIALENLRKLTAGLRKEEIEAAEAAVHAHKATLERLLAGATPDAIAAARARVNLARAQLARLELDIADLTIVAPVDGIIESVLVEPGENASPGQPIITLVASDQIWVEFFVPERLLSRMHAGVRLTMIADPFPQTPFNAEVFYISPSAEFTPRNIFTPEERLNQVFRVKAKPLSPPVSLRSGMGITVFLPSK